MGVTSNQIFQSSGKKNHNPIQIQLKCKVIDDARNLFKYELLLLLSFTTSYKSLRMHHGGEAPAEKKCFSNRILSQVDGWMVVSSTNPLAFGSEAGNLSRWMDVHFGSWA